MAVTKPPELEVICHLPLARDSEIGSRLDISTNRLEGVCNFSSLAINAPGI